MSHNYKIHITSTAEHDIMRAVDYIEFTLKNVRYCNGAH